MKEHNRWRTEAKQASVKQKMSELLCLRQALHCQWPRSASETGQKVAILCADRVWKARAAWCGERSNGGNNADDISMLPRSFGDESFVSVWTGSVRYSFPFDFLLLTDHAVTCYDLHIRIYVYD